MKTLSQIMISVFFTSFLFLFSCTQDDSFYNYLAQAGEGIPIDHSSDGISEGLVTDVSSNGLKAFSSAFGAGIYSEGWRGGKVLHVNSLEDDYTTVKEGTLRWALTQKFPRIIVFDVSGVIELNGMIFLNQGHSNFYLAGQTSPGGIMLKGYSIWTSALSDVVIRNVKFYGDPEKIIAPNDPSKARRPLLRFGSPKNVMVDHCDFVFNRNEAVNFWGSNGVTAGGATLQNCLIGEGVTGTLMGGDECSTNLGGEYSAIRNLYVHISHRTPNFTASVKGEAINNVTYNTKARLSRVSCTAQANFYGNYYKAGPATYFNQPNRVNLVRDDDGADVYIDSEYWSWMDGRVTSVSDPKTLIFNAAISGTNQAKAQQPSTSKWLRDTPVLLLGERPLILDNSRAFDYVLNNAGARRYMNADGSFREVLDSKQTQYINDVRTTGNTNGSGSDYGVGLGIFDHPQIPALQRATNYDSDKDGMPDVWEIANGLNPNVADDFEDADGDSYTNLEEFLNLIDDAD